MVDSLVGCGSHSHLPFFLTRIFIFLRFLRFSFPSFLVDRASAFTSQESWDESKRSWRKYSSRLNIAAAREFGNEPSKFARNSVSETNAKRVRVEVSLPLYRELLIFPRKITSDSVKLKVFNSTFLILQCGRYNDRF